MVRAAGAHPGKGRSVRGLWPAALGRGVARRARHARNRLRLRRQRLYDYAPVPALVTSVTDVPTARFPAVDVHNHLGRWLNDGRRWMTHDVPALVAGMDELGVATVVNLDGRWDAELEANLDRYDRAHPGRFATFCHVDWSLLAQAGSPDKLVKQVHRAAAAGACGLKVWKDLGLSVRDESGALVAVDDARLAGIWEAAAELRLPVLIHTADPAAFWLPLDRHNERLEELTMRPDWHYGSRSVPARESLMTAFGRLVASHPGTTFIAAHVASSAENLAGVGRMLDEHPNLAVDLSAQLAELGRQPRAAREFITRHADRVLWGTDVFPFDRDSYRTWFRLLESDDEYFPYSTSPVPPQGRWAVSGLALPPDVLEAVYAGNARRLIRALPGPSPVGPSGT